MKISKQNAVISLATGVISFALCIAVIDDQLALLIGPAVAAMSWAYFSKKEGSKN